MSFLLYEVEGVVAGPRELLDAYAAQIPPITALEPREHAAPKAFAALRAVLDLHPSRLVEGRNADGDERQGRWCDCCDEAWPCQTVQAITKALEAE